MTPPFKKILIANRGEIAVRIIAACRELGIASVGVYSDVDRRAMHVLKADEACLLGQAPARDSYLVMERILDAARHTGAEAIHPGYGFLSENAAFARACRDAGIVFIGPSPEAMERMGSKTEARRAALGAGVPILSGSMDPLDTHEMALEKARSIGLPVLLKARAGGGGKGMRVIHREEDLTSSFERASSEAGAAFGDPSLYMEKYLADARHVEIQVLADAHGKAIHLGERECSIQRRHQKLVEESPAPALRRSVRDEMGEAALACVRAAGYTNAGTVEFLVDQRENFYFLEMNTRLQVEHPVTEMVTGVDIVAEQIRIAAGKHLSIPQSEVRPRGHAVECRIMAEDPFDNFAPSPGRLRLYREPRRPWVRVDSGVYAGATIPIHYDPLIAKVIAWGPDRPRALARIRSALRDFVLEGIASTIPFHIALLDDARFEEGPLNTSFLDRHLAELTQASDRKHSLVAAMAAALLHDRARKEAPADASRSSAGNGRWRWSLRNGGPLGGVP